MIKDKKGLGIGQAFIFIVAAITFALIMLFGYNSITDLLHRGQQLEFTQFKSSLEDSVKRIYDDYGSVDEVDFHLPSEYKQICFVNLDHDYEPDGPDNQDDPGLCSMDPLACTIWESAQEGRTDENGDEIKGYDAEEENVFIRPRLDTSVRIKVYKIKIAADADGNERGYLCLPIERGRFSLVLEGKGNHAELSEAEH